MIYPVEISSNMGLNDVKRTVDFINYVFNYDTNVEWIL